jgi:hypothetical protein
MTNNSLVIDDEQSASSVAATSVSEELSGAEEICCVCKVIVGLISISAVLVCESCSNYFNSIGEDITCVDGLNRFTEGWCARSWVDIILYTLRPHGQLLYSTELYNCSQPAAFELVYL